MLIAVLPLRVQLLICGNSPNGLIRLLFRSIFVVSQHKKNNTIIDYYSVRVVRAYGAGDKGGGGDVPLTEGVLASP